MYVLSVSGYIHLRVLPDTNMTSVQFRCCICLDTYIDPVSIPCGHNFCRDCIEGFWDTKEKSECPLCKETFRERPELRINRAFAEIIELLERFVFDTLSAVGKPYLKKSKRFGLN